MTTPPSPEGLAVAAAAAPATIGSSPAAAGALLRSRGRVRRPTGGEARQAWLGFCDERAN